MYLLTNTKYINDEAYLKLITRLNKKKTLYELRTILKTISLQRVQKTKNKRFKFAQLIKNLLQIFV